ncbi:MAG: hypothetical protein AAGK97_04295, partial [Bacteroidota bacterium]
MANQCTPSKGMVVGLISFSNWMKITYTILFLFIVHISSAQVIEFSSTTPPNASICGAVQEACITLTYEGPDSIQGVDFTCEYDLANWAIMDGVGSVTPNAPTSIDFTSADATNGDNMGQPTFIEISAPFDGCIEFDWTFATMDTTEQEFFGYLINGGTMVDIADSSPGAAQNQSGTETICVMEGDNIRILVRSEDTVIDSLPSQVTISNFAYGTDPDISNQMGPLTSSEDMGVNIDFGSIAPKGSAPAPIVMGNVLSFPDVEDLMTGDTLVSFTFEFRLGCDFDLTNGDFTFLFDYTYEGLDCLEGLIELPETNPIGVQAADLSTPTSTPSSIDAYFGLQDTITTQVVNAGNGALDTAYYCLLDNANAVPQSIILCNAGSASTPITATLPGTAGQTCFIISGPDLAQILPGEEWPANTAFDVKEAWEITGCGPAEDFQRRLQFGCTGSIDCQMKPQGDFLSTGQTFGISVPSITAELVSQFQPACYADEITEIVIKVTNDGLAPASNLIIDITPAGGAFNPATYSITTADGTPIVDQTPEIQTVDGMHCTGGVRAVTDTVKGIDLQPDSMLIITYGLSHSCDCNNCSLRGIYGSTFDVVSIIDRCDESLPPSATSSDVVLESDRNDAFMSGLTEAPAQLNDGAESCITYTITSVDLDWFRGDTFPNTYLEFMWNVPCGFDLATGSMADIVWTDRNGQEFPLCDFEYIDNNAAGDDMVRARWCASDFPSGFDVAPGMTFKMNLVVVCDEKPDPPGCSTEVFDLVVDGTLKLTIDPTCTSCPTEKIYAPDQTTTRIYCPDPDCDCEGLIAEDIIIERVNFGEGDQNSDQVPDGTLGDVLPQRFLQGDTLKATFIGTVNDDDGVDDMWQYGFSTIDFDHLDFTPLSASVIIDDIDGDRYTCE